ncbi:MAG: putative transport system permease protein [Betaproteobacteria bacterium]|nr:putative transport system permease protein [Betaproteobacteria bacterium]
MTWLAGVRIALRALRVHKLRSGLTMLGIIIGIAAVITMIAIGSGAQAQVEEQIKALGTNLIIVTPGSVTSGGVRMGAGSRASLTEDDAYALQRELPDVQAAAPTLRGSGPMVFGASNWTTSFHGSTVDFFEARNWQIASGKRFDAEDVTGAAKVMLLGETVARNLFGDSDPIGQIVRVRTVPMEVIGVMERKGQTLQGNDQDDMILIPITTARNRLLGGSQAKLRLVHYISVKVRDGADMTQTDDDMRTLLRQRHRRQSGQDDGFTLRNLSEVLSAREASTRIMTLLLAAVASISLLVGGIGIMNIMLVSVTERTREIGLRMAVGARGRDILSQFLAEAVTLALVGGLFGILLGIGSSAAIAYFAGWHTVLNLNAIVLAVVFAALVGVFFGFYPARKASRLLPIEALRYE